MRLRYVRQGSAMLCWVMACSVSLVYDMLCEVSLPEVRLGYVR